MRQNILFISIFAFALNHCVTPSKEERFDPKNAPNLTEDTPVEKIIEGAIDFGGIQMDKARTLITKKKAWSQTVKIVAQDISDNMQTYESFQLVNAVNLLQISPYALDEGMFLKLVSSGRQLAKQLGWQLAAAKPSKKVAAMIDKELTRAITENDENSVFLQQVAAAVQANHLKSSYSLMRQALFTTNQEYFALAMAALEPQKASEDFIEYLAIAPVDELRQITMHTLDPFTCMFALQHLERNPASVTNPRIEVLFLYGISRNTALADEASRLLDKYFEENPGLFAQLLGRQQVWVQVAFIENIRRNNNATKKKFLSELRNTSSSEEVLDELREMQL